MRVVGLRFLQEHLEVRIFVRRVLLVFGMADQINPEALQPPSLDAGPVAHKFHVVILIAYGEPYIVSAVVRPGFEEHRALWRLDAPAEFQRFFQCRKIRVCKARRLGIKMNVK